jgi:hypothetical protein
VTNSEYHSHPAWSQSAAKLLPKQPELFHARHVAKTLAMEPSPAFEFGSAVHGLLSGCDTVVEVPADVLTSNGQRRGKAWEQFQTEHNGSLLLLPSTFAKVRAAADSILSDPAAKRLVEPPGDWEESIFWTDQNTGLELKARPDKQAVFGSETVLVDLKTTSSDPADYDDISWSCLRYGYDFQAAWYMDGIASRMQSVEAFVFIFVQSEPPFVCRVYELSEDAIERGQKNIETSLRDLAERLNTNNWHGKGYGDYLPLDLPPKAYRKEYAE